MKLSDAQRTLLGYLADGARLSWQKTGQQWNCIMPNGMTFRVGKATVQKLYERQCIRQDRTDYNSYVISHAGKFVASP